MHYETELSFMCDILRKCHVQANILDLTQPLEQRLAMLDKTIHLGSITAAKNLVATMPETKPGILYRLQDQLGCHYLYCLLPHSERPRLLIVGPFLTEAPDPRRVLEWAEGRHVSYSHLQHLQDYYGTIPVLENTSRLFAIIDAFGERLWGKEGFTVQDVAQKPYNRFAPVGDGAGAEDPLFYMRTLEQRYAHENEMMNAIAKGQFHKVDILLRSFSHLSFEQRASTPLRNTQNYCIIMNTLLRKAAEQGGVHPLNLDRISSDFAIRIEQTTSQDAIAALLPEMLHAYCRLVQKNSLKGYSPLIQRAITLIEADLGSSLNLHALAQNLNISSSYLSSLFKKETGKTLTSYILERRMEHAQNLLSGTKLQVQTVAQHCGIADVQYFAKLFKKATGMTPTEYRQAASP